MLDMRLGAKGAIANRIPNRSTPMSSTRPQDGAHTGAMAVSISASALSNRPRNKKSGSFNGTRSGVVASYRGRSHSISSDGPQTNVGDVQAVAVTTAKPQHHDRADISVHFRKNWAAAERARNASRIATR